MIISASRRTDIPAFYSDWFFRRLQAGDVLVRNPMNPRQVSSIHLTPDVVDGIVFWTKNPLPMMGRLNELAAYPYYFQFTLTPYGKEVEPGLPEKDGVLVPAFQALSRQIGRERVVWRYDPIFFSAVYTPQYHQKAFAALAQKLHPYTEKCTLSFLDDYRSIAGNIKPLHLLSQTPDQRLDLMAHFARTAACYGLALDTCAEGIDLSSLGISHARCIDKARLEKIGGFTLLLRKDTGQRPECGCYASIDIGAYHTCQNGCHYCYANHSALSVQRSVSRYQADSPLLCDQLTAGDVVMERRIASCRDGQTSFLP